MAPPAYEDLGKSARELFNKHYSYGYHKLSCRLTSPEGVVFTVNGDASLETGNVASFLTTKYKVKSSGVLLTQKWTSDNVLSGGAVAEDFYIRGLKLGLSSKLDMMGRKSTACVTCGYKSLFVNLNNDVEISNSRATLIGSGVFGYRGWLSGLKVTLDPMKNELSKSSFTVGYQTPYLQVFGHVDDGQRVNCSIFQRVNENLDAGININRSTEPNVNNFDLGLHYRLSEITAVRGKINNSKQIGMCLIHRLQPGWVLNFSCSVDASSMTGSHTVGVGLDVDV